MIHPSLINPSYIGDSLARNWLMFFADETAFCKLRYKYFRLGGRYVGFPTSGANAHAALHLVPLNWVNPEKIGFPVETAFLTGLRADI